MVINHIHAFIVEKYVYKTLLSIVTIYLIMYGNVHTVPTYNQVPYQQCNVTITYRSFSVAHNTVNNSLCGKHTLNTLLNPGVLYTNNTSCQLLLIFLQNCYSFITVGSAYA